MELSALVMIRYYSRYSLIIPLLHVAANSPACDNIDKKNHGLSGIIA